MAKSTPTNATEDIYAPGAHLPVANQSGATFNTEYLERRVQVVPVNRNDLEDLLAYDTDAIAFGGIGTFLLSGAAWILVEQLLGDNGVWLDDGIHMNPLSWVCLAACLFGGFMLWLGYRQHDRKRKRINRIFAETKPKNSATGPGNAPTNFTGATRAG